MDLALAGELAPLGLAEPGLPPLALISRMMAD